MGDYQKTDPGPRGDRMPEDIDLDEAGRNRVMRRQAEGSGHPVRRMAADAFVTSAIGSAYGADW